MIYLDYNATTPVAPEVFRAMRPYLEEEFGKPTFTNMSAEVWNDLVRPGIIPPVQGWGRLLTMKG